MNLPSKGSLILTGVGAIALLLLFVSMRKNRGRSQSGPLFFSNSGDFGNTGHSTEDSDGSSMRSTKTDRVRPTAEELAKKRAESRRVELVRKLQKMRDGGLNDQHPAIKNNLGELAKDPDVRTELKNDETYTLWTRRITEDGSLVNQYQFEAGGEVSLKTIHRLNQNGSPLSSKIFDEKNNELFKISYGYRRSDGMLVEERIFDSQNEKLDNRGGDPVRRIVHRGHDDDGSPEADVVDLVPPNFPPQMEMGFKNPFLQ